jgi:hypothetical protein
MPMLVSSATTVMGRKPANSAEPMPMIHVTRVGTFRFRSVTANQAGSRPSRLMENQTRDAPSMNVSITVTTLTIAPTATTFATAGRPTDSKAVAKPLSGLMSV